MLGIGELMVIFMILIMLPLIGLWIWMVVDCATREAGEHKVLWLLLVVLGGVVGAIVYLAVRRRARERELGR
jgi:fructose-specific phosphotransferase system IIC component